MVVLQAIGEIAKGEREMRSGKLTPKEEEIIRQLLAERGITVYKVSDTESEGKTLPGSSYPGEIESISGYIVTATTVYLFWLDWEYEHYTLGDQEVSLEMLGSDKNMIVELQNQLRAEQKDK